MVSRITRRMVPAVICGHTSRRQVFQLNIDPADRIDELKLDVTAPMMAPMPSRATSGGAVWVSSSGSASAGCADSRACSAAGHAYANAATPISSGGTVSAMVSRPDRMECHCARAGVWQDSTRWK